jgi:hypothetical protein
MSRRESQTVPVDSGFTHFGNDVWEKTLVVGDGQVVNIVLGSELVARYNIKH